MVDILEVLFNLKDRLRRCNLLGSGSVCSFDAVKLRETCGHILLFFDEIVVGDARLLDGSETISCTCTTGGLCSLELYSAFLKVGI